jgi:hypothetical protein
MGVEFDGVRFSRDECLEAVRYILKQRGVPDQNSERAYVQGNLRIVRTNTGDFEVTAGGKLVLSVPLVPSSKDEVWEPADWVERVYDIMQRIKHSDSVNNQERNSRAKEYCEGYKYGFWRGREDPGAVVSEGGPSYQAGFARGVVAANLAKYGYTSANQSSKEAVSDQVQELEETYYRQHQDFTEEQSRDWNALQAGIKRRGENSYQEILSEMYRHLGGLYYEDIVLRGTKEEAAAVNSVVEGIVRRLAHTSIQLPMPERSRSA